MNVVEIITQPGCNCLQIHSASHRSLFHKFCALGGGKNKNSKAGYGVKADVDLAEMEKAQPLGEHKLAVDAVSG